MTPSQRPEIINRIIFSLRLKYLLYFGRPVLIWNMGKVASTSVARSLWGYVGRRNVIATHFLNKDGNYRSKALYNELFANSEKPISIIALTREPVGKNISSFFQNFETNVGIPAEKYDLHINDLCDYFFNNFNKHDTTINWFDDNFKNYLGIDVYSYPFDPVQGYSIIDHGRYDILLLRSEATNDVKEKAIKELLGLDEFTLTNENVGSEKPYSRLYNEFQQAVHIPQSYLDRMLNSRYTQHFYDIEEINRIRASWQK